MVDAAGERDGYEAKPLTINTLNGLQLEAYSLETLR